jgi:hypothetical protein
MFGKIFRALDSVVFEACFRQWIASFVGAAEGIIALGCQTDIAAQIVD